MPSPISNKKGLTIRRVLNETYAHRKTRTRFKYKIRDAVQGILIQKVSTYDGKAIGTSRTKFIIKTQSTPQYYPYYTKFDARGRPRKRQVKHKHYYEVTIQLDTLSLDAPFKMRVGGLARWDFSPAGKDKRVKKNRTFVIVPGTNTKRGLNGDFFFRCEWVYYKAGILFGRNWTNRAPVKANPRRIVFFPKHALAAIELLMNRGYLK